MREVIAILEQQVAWQKQRKDLSWPEKVRMVEAIRDSILKLRQAQPAEPIPSGTAKRVGSPN